MESLGQKIQLAAHTGITKQLSTIAERTEINASHYDYETGMSASTMEAVAAIDDAIDEALEDEPTPPKRHCPQEEIVISTYKTPKLNHDSPCKIEDNENTLAHSLSMYRKQKPMKYIVGVIAVVGVWAAVCSASPLEDAKERQAKFLGLNFPFLNLVTVTVKPTPCLAKSDNSSGTCTNKGSCDGREDGTCASGYGVCCVFEKRCGSTVTQNVTFLVNDEYPDALKGIGNCQYNIEKFLENTTFLSLFSPLFSPSKTPLFSPRKTPSFSLPRKHPFSPSKTPIFSPSKHPFLSLENTAFLSLENTNFLSSKTPLFSPRKHRFSPLENTNFLSLENTTFLSLENTTFLSLENTAFSPSKTILFSPSKTPLFSPSKTPLFSPSKTSLSLPQNTTFLSLANTTFLSVENTTFLSLSL
ncbi:hypothetical protein C7M84_023111 [Penaeus vannamei]|uniref:Uncharacterized protein n=1 Tax=Penaeus vannamei TaxID=6689 RepID=A0A423U4R9_PENVA|nr:hypothetical protein C7M84_023111 [Penaeus vannamei]